MVHRHRQWWWRRRNTIGKKKISREILSESNCYRWLNLNLIESSICCKFFFSPFYPLIYPLLHLADIPTYHTDKTTHANKWVFFFRHASWSFSYMPFGTFGVGFIYITCNTCREYLKQIHRLYMLYLESIFTYAAHQMGVRFCIITHSFVRDEIILIFIFSIIFLNLIFYTSRFKKMSTRTTSYMLILK